RRARSRSTSARRPGTRARARTPSSRLCSGRSHVARPSSRSTSDAATTGFRDENEQLNRELVAAPVPHVFHVYPGGHQQTVWSAHARAWLELALEHLSAARP